MKPKSWLLWHSMVKWKFSPSSYKKGVNSDFVARCAVWIHGHIRVGKSNTKHTYNTCFGFIMDTRIAIRLNAWPPTAVVIFYYQHQPFFVHKTFCHKLFVYALYGVVQAMHFYKQNSFQKLSRSNFKQFGQIFSSAKVRT